jgi:predicted aspartyl protease
VDRSPSPIKLIAFLLLAILLLPFAARAGSQDLERTRRGHLITQVRIAGHGKQWFVVDTGAAASAVYAHARTRLGLKAEPGADVEMHAAGGSQWVRRYRLPRLSVAGMDADHLLVSGLPEGIQHGEEVAGVLGGDVLGRHLVEFDLVSGRLGLHRTGERPSSLQGWNEVPIRLMPSVGVVLVDVIIEGAVVPAVLDTGARQTFINWAAARAAGTTAKEDLTLVKTAGGATRHAVRYSLRKFAGISIGQTQFGDRMLAISDMPVFVAIGMDRAPAMIVGLDLLGGRRFLIDYPARRLLIER